MHIKRASVAICLFAMLAMSLASAVPARADSCRIARPHSVDPAEDAYLHEKFADAEALFRAALASKPGDEILTAWLVRSLLRQEKAADAAAAVKVALTAAPNSAILLTARAEVEYRQGSIIESAQSASAAYDADICYARMHLIRARLAALNSMYAVEQSEILNAHSLDPYDPEIRRAWIDTLPLKQKAAELKKHLGDPGLSDDARRDTETYIDELERLAAEPARQCQLVSSESSAKLPLQSILEEQFHPRSWALMVKLNNKDTKLEVDTGADEIYISRKAAERAGLRALGKIESVGVGDRGPDSGFVAVVDSIRVGALEFRDCIVSVSDRKNVGDTDGLIGMSIFSNFLIGLDYPLYRLELSPLPPRPGETAVPVTLETPLNEIDRQTEGNAGATAHARIETGPKDRYVASDMKTWSPVFRVGNHLLIPAAINKSASKLFMIDSGSDTTIISRAAASEIMHVTETSEVRIWGVNGEVDHVYTGGSFTLQFADKIQDSRESIVLDTSRLSNEMGIEVSGFIGLPALKFLTTKIDYRDGLVKFEYDPGLAQRNR